MEPDRVSGAAGRSVVLRLVHESGLWAGERRETHAFRPTDSLVYYTQDQVASMKALGPAIGDLMDGMSRIAAIAVNPDLARGSAWQLMRRVVNMECPGFMKSLQGLYPARAPQLVKVDLMEAACGQIFIAEIDATNRRGMGYTSLFERIREEVAPNVRAIGVPIVDAIAGLVKQICKRTKVKPQLGYIYAHKERFYRPEFEILKRELAKRGVELLLGDECEVKVDGDELLIAGVRCESRLLTDLALKLEHMQLAQELARLYCDGHVRTVIPPRPFLGSKALLALLHNEEGDPKIESILQSQIDRGSIDLLRRHVPVTRFVTSDSVRPARGVLKQVVSSGMKGVYFADGDDFDVGFADARKRPYNYVLQDEVDCVRRSFRVLNDKGHANEELRTRLIVYYVSRQLAGGVITGCDSKSVHGGKSAVFTAAAIE